MVKFNKLFEYFLDVVFPAPKEESKIDVPAYCRWCARKLGDNHFFDVTPCKARLKGCCDIWIEGSMPHPKWFDENEYVDEETNEIKIRPKFGEKVVIVEQPDPVENDGPAIWDLVVDDMKTRDDLGFERYGVRLQANNDRDMLHDAYEEALDLVVYLRGVIEERNKK